MRFLFLLATVCVGTAATQSASASTNPVAQSSKVQQHNVATPVAKAGAQRSTGNNKFVICHKGHEITVAASAVPAHLAHGDSQGSCGSSEPSQGL